MAGIYISEKLLKIINEGGKSYARIDCIEIEVQTALETAKKITNEQQKLTFYGMQFEKLAQDLKELGLIDY